MNSIYKNYEDAINDLQTAFSSIAVSAKDLEHAVQDFFSSHIPPFTEEDIIRVRLNPSLTFVQKVRIIREIKKNMKGED